jgi:outer membrane protein TolC
MKKFFLSICFFSAVCALQAQEKILSLDDCLDLALKQSKELKIKQEEVKVAEAKKKQATSAYLPKVDAILSYTHISDVMYLLPEDKFLPIGTKMADGSFGFRQDQVNNQWTLVNGQPTPLDAGGQPFNPKTDPDKILWKDYTTIPRDELAVDMRNTYVGMLSLVQPIYMGGKIVQANKMAKIGVDIANEQKTMETNEVLYNTEAAYWTVVSVANKVKVASDYQKLLTQLDKNVTELQAEGMATKADVLKVKVKLNQINMDLTKAENGLNLAKMNLCQMIGLPMEQAIALEDEINPKESIYIPDNNSVSLDAALSNRPEIKSLEKLIDLSEAKKKLAVSGYLPEIGLTANYLYTNPDFFNGFEKEFSGSWNVGVVMKIPILHWGDNHQKIKEAKSEQIITQTKLDNAKEKIELQYRQATYRIDESTKKLKAANSNLEQASENLRYAQLSFDEGVVGVSDVLDAQASHFAAYSDQTDAQIELKINQLFLKKVSGKMRN